MQTQKLYNGLKWKLAKIAKMEFASAIFKNCIFANILLKGVLNRLPPFKNLCDHTNRFLIGQ